MTLSPTMESVRFRRSCLIVTLFASAGFGAETYKDHLQAGMRAAEQGRTAEAIAEYHAALRLNTSDAEVHYRRGLLLAQASDFHAAETAFRRAVQLKPEHAEAHYSLGLLCIANPTEKLDWPQAAAEFRAAANSRDNYPEAWNMLGVALSSMSRPQEAMKAFGQALQLRPNFPEAHLNLGLSLEVSGQRDKAVAEYRIALSQRADSAEALIALGKALVSDGQRGSAREVLIAALRIKPDAADAHYILARALQADGDAYAAKAEFEQASELTTRRQRRIEAASLSNHALDLARQGELAEAIRTARRAVLLQPDYAPAHYNLGLLLADSKQLDKAAAELVNALSFMPARTEPYLNLTRVLRLKGDTAHAAAVIARAKMMAPDDERIAREVVALSGVRPSASEYLFGAGSDTAEAHFTFARHLIAQGDLLGAIGELLRTLELKPAWPEARRSLAVAWLQQGDRHHAELEFRKTITLAPDDIESRFGLGVVASERGELPTAIEQFDEVLRRNPGHQQARRLRDVAVRKQTLPARN